MAFWTVIITETLRKEIAVTAEDVQSAIDKAECMYKNGEVILSGDDFVEYNVSLDQE